MQALRSYQSPRRSESTLQRYEMIEADGGTGWKHSRSPSTVRPYTLAYHPLRKTRSISTSLSTVIFRWT